MKTLETPYELCLDRAVKILHQVKTDHPRIALAITITNLLGYISEKTEKILEPSRGKMFTDERYLKLYTKLQRVNVDKFFKRLIQ